MYEISFQTKRVGDALYNSDWLDASLPFKKSMLIIMSRSLVPIEFKVLGDEPLGIEHLCKVITWRPNCIVILDLRILREECINHAQLMIVLIKFTLAFVY